MNDEKFVDPFDAPPPEKVVSGRLETRDLRVVTKVFHTLRAADHNKLVAHAEKFGSDVPTLLRGIVEDFVKGLSEPPENS